MAVGRRCGITVISFLPAVLGWGLAEYLKNRGKFCCCACDMEFWVVVTAWIFDDFCFDGGRLASEWPVGLLSASFLGLVCLGGGLI